MTKKILLSAGMILFVATGVAGMTGAFFSDVETSTGNTFTAGAIDLKVDNTCHYWEMVGTSDTGAPIWRDKGCEDGSEAQHNWAETNLIPGVHKFFSFNDIKPGDKGESTISLHVYNNDAWGGFRVNRVAGSDKDNTCTEPEIEAEPGCDPSGSGELDDQMVGKLCLDQGSVPGFQNVGSNGSPIDGNLEQDGIQPVDPTEGDNICQEGEPVLQRPEGQNGFFDVFYDLSSVLSSAYIGAGCTVPNGANNYGRCQGLAQDGRMVRSTTYYFAWEWELPPTVGNNAQTDSIMGDVVFNVVQHRNNPNKVGLQPPM